VSACVGIVHGEILAADAARLNRRRPRASRRAVGHGSAIRLSSELIDTDDELVHLTPLAKGVIGHLELGDCSTLGCERHAERTTHA
jgi:hypothetical protein